MELGSGGLTEPKLGLHQVAATWDAAANGWNIHWQVENLGRERLSIESVWMPHGQFKSAEKRFSPALALPPGESSPIATVVHCQEPAGLVTENAFVIFHCRWDGQDWRVFVRLRVTLQADGEPQTATELITTQKVGFSGLSE